MDFSVVGNASELHVGGVSSIPKLGNNFPYFLTTPHREEFAQLKPRLGILVYESNEEPVTLNQFFINVGCKSEFFIHIRGCEMDA